MRKEYFRKIRASFLINAPKTTQTSYAPERPLVLVADDHEDTRLLYRTVIETRGYFVIEAADGEETVRNAESARPDLILMDGSLPRMSGLDATRQIRGSADVGNVPIVFVSGHSGTVFLALAHEAGCDEYLVKPFNLDKLEHILEKYCSKDGRAVAI